MESSMSILPGLQTAAEEVRGGEPIERPAGAPPLPVGETSEGEIDAGQGGAQPDTRDAAIEALGQRVSSLSDVVQRLAGAVSATAARPAGPTRESPPPDFEN